MVWFHPSSLLHNGIATPLGQRSRQNFFLQQCGVKLTLFLDRYRGLQPGDAIQEIRRLEESREFGRHRGRIMSRVETDDRTSDELTSTDVKADVDRLPAHRMPYIRTSAVSGMSLVVESSSSFITSPLATLFLPRCAAQIP